MSVWTLVILIVATWFSYPLAGGAVVRLEVLEGKRAKDAGFSFLPELLVLPATFFVVAAVIDHFAMPYGRWFVGGVCVLMLGVHGYILVRCFVRVRRLERRKRSEDEDPA
ncbi:MAG: hypothetical protein JNL97_00480 [Verrucomicrobiales bacterium]|nr:hypothetical protein [Verrucomicrobiales bacterium]